MMVSKFGISGFPGLHFQVNHGSIFRFVDLNPAFFRWMLPVTTFFLMEGNATSEKLWSDIMSRLLEHQSATEKNPPTVNIPRPTSNLKEPMKQKSSRKKTSSPFRRRRPTSPLHQRNWSAWQRRAASAGLSGSSSSAGWIIGCTPIPTYPYGWNP